MRLKRWSEVDETHKEVLAVLLLCAAAAGTLFLLLVAPVAAATIMALALLAGLAYPWIEWGDDA